MYGQSLLALTSHMTTSTKNVQVVMVRVEEHGTRAQQPNVRPVVVLGRLTILVTMITLIIITIVLIAKCIVIITAHIILLETNINNI